MLMKSTKIEVCCSSTMLLNAILCPFTVVNFKKRKIIRSNIRMPAKSVALLQIKSNKCPSFPYQTQVPSINGCDVAFPASTSHCITFDAIASCLNSHHFGRGLSVMTTDFLLPHCHVFRVTTRRIEDSQSKVCCLFNCSES